MNIKYIKEHQIVERYLQRRLSEEELEEFELSFLENPEILKELNRVRSLREALREHPEFNNEFRNQLSKNQQVSETDFENKTNNTAADKSDTVTAWRNHRFGLAATLLLLPTVALLGYGLGNQRSANDAYKGQPVFFNSETVLERTRGPVDEVIAITAKQNNLLRIDVGPTEYSKYSLKLMGQGRTPIFSVSDNITTVNNFLVMEIDELDLGTYHLTVDGVTESGQIQSLGRYKLVTQ